jgi:hypothetical protein
MPWQRYAADVGLEIVDGRFAYQLVIVTVPRQSGKTTLFGFVLDHRAITTPNARAWFTMQTQKDAVDWLTNEHFPLLAPFGPASSLRRMAGSEHIRWNQSGGLVRPFPPNPTGLHGKVADVVVIDECWAFDPVRGSQLDQAIVPTQATRPNAQTFKLSTAGDANSVYWLGVVEQGRAAVEAGKTSGICYVEWSCPDDLDPCDPHSWPLYHPAYGRTIGRESMEAALSMLGADEFARSFGNRWVSMVARVIPIGAWRNAAEPDAALPQARNVALAFDVALDRSEGTIVAAYRDAQGVAHVEVADHRPGVGWIPDRAADLSDSWSPVAFAYDDAGPALDVADVMTRRGLDLTPIRTKDYGAACSSFLDALNEDPPSVRVRPHPAMDTAAAAAARRTLGDAWAWGRRQSATSIAPLTAATVALWAYDHAPVPIGDFRVY